jgi:hypothetical protein
MAKTKKIVVDCSYCKDRIEIEVPVDIVKNREYYPFEYINVHGSPEHALMLFLDQHLTVRDTMVYDDLNIAKQQKAEFASITRMSEIDAFASIYSDPLRSKLFEILMGGPITEDVLLEKLEEEEDFEVQKFNLLVLPLRKTGLLTTSYLFETFFECYFLINDFLILRIPSQINLNSISKDIRFSPFIDSYINKVNEVFNDYYLKFLSNKEKQLEEIKLGLEILTNDDLEKVIRVLRNGPHSSKELSELVNIDPLQELIDNNIVMKLGSNGETYYALLSDIKVEKFTPKYLLNAISTKLKNQEISLEMAKKHLELLNKAELK